jgi:hypothetical protein
VRVRTALARRGPADPDRPTGATHRQLGGSVEPRLHVHALDRFPCGPGSTQHPDVDQLWEVAAAVATVATRLPGWRRAPAAGTTVGYPTVWRLGTCASYLYVVR